MKYSKKHIIRWVAVNFCRLFIALVFLASGFIKAVDPLGMSYKINEYLKGVGILLSYDSLIPLSAAVILSLLESLLGVNLFLGIRRRLTVVSAFVFMLVMTVVTTYIYIYNPVNDCGCFGDAITLTHQQTLIKNVILLIFSTYVLFENKFIRRFITERNQWLISTYSFIYIVGLNLYTIHYLPILDFTEYKNNVNLKTAIMEGKNPKLMGFYLTSIDGLQEHTFDVLTDTNYTFLLTIPEVTTADDGCNDRINDLYDLCEENHINFYGVITSDSLDLADWQDRTGAAYPFLRGDEMQLRYLVRSNPGLVVLKDGVIKDKWSNNNLPELNSGIKNIENKNKSPLTRLLFWFVVPLLVIIFLDAIFDIYKNYKHFILKLFNIKQHEKENCSR